MKASGDRATMTIGELAGRYGLATHVLRHWESVGLLAPARVRGQRRYTEADARQVSYIVTGRRFGLGLPQLKDLLTSYDRPHRDAALRRYQEILERQAAQIRDQLALVEHGLACPVADYRDCPHVAELVSGTR